MKITKISKLNNPLDGRSKQAAKNMVYKLVGDLTKGSFSDIGWGQVHLIWETLENAGIENFSDNQYYLKDESGNPASKTWEFYIPFINNRGNEDKLQGQLRAHLFGENQGSSDRYDISFVVS